MKSVKGSIIRIEIHAIPGAHNLARTEQGVKLVYLQSRVDSSLVQVR